MGNDGRNARPGRFPRRGDFVKTTARLLAAFAVALLARGSAAAQLPTAPPPHLALEGLVKDYKRYGLPVPPPNAELVWVRWSSTAEPCVPALRCPPAKPDGFLSYIVGTRSWSQQDGYLYVISRPEPTPETLRDLSRAGNDLLSLALQFKIRGWDSLAGTTYDVFRAEQAMSAQSIADPEQRRWIEQQSPAEALQGVAWSFWAGQVSVPGTDRRECLARLKMVAWDGPAFNTPGYRAYLRDVEATAAPRKSRPGTVEALIDDLTEYWIPDSAEPNAGQIACQKLSEMGFAAVPALIEHTQDSRFTRQSTMWFVGNFRPYTLRVGHLVSRLLDDLSDGQLQVWDLRGDMADPGEALKWWGEAQLVGEEKWLAEHALPARDPEAEAPYVANVVIFSALGAKYPARLAEVYRTVLRKRPILDTTALAHAIATSKLPRQQKVALLEEGAAHSQPTHRLAALNALADADLPAFRKNLIRTLEGPPKDIEAASYSMRPEENLGWLVQRSDDPKCWDAFAATTRRVSVRLRFQLLRAAVAPSVEWDLLPSKVPPLKRERARYLLGFLNDRSVRGTTPPPDSDEAAEGSPTVEVRDFAASQLAWVLGRDVPSDPDRGPLERFLIRAAVRKVAERELPRLGK